MPGSRRIMLALLVVPVFGVCVAIPAAAAARDAGSPARVLSCGPDHAVCGEPLPAAPLVSAPGADAAAVPCVDASPVQRCPVWSTTYAGPAGGPDGAGEGLLSAKIVATSPDGATVYTAGTSDGDPGTGLDGDGVVVALDAATGARRWVARYAGTDTRPFVNPFAIGVAPDGRTVYVGATNFTPDGSECDVAVFAVDTAAGTIAWSATMGTRVCNQAMDLAVAPDGSRVYVTGSEYDDGTSEENAITAALAPATGAVLWTARYGAGTPRAFGFRLAAAPDGSAVYVAAGTLEPGGYTNDVILLAYDPATGHLLHESHHPTKGVPPAGIVMSPDSSRVFVEEANLETGLNNALTIAYDRAGNEVWTARLRGCDQFKCSARPWYYDPIAVSPDGSRVFVTSLGVNVTEETHVETVAYDAATGVQQWLTTTDGNVGDCFCGPTVVAGRGTVYVSGLLHATLASDDNETDAFDAATGALRWMSIDRENVHTATDGIAIDPSGSRVFAAGAEASPDGTSADLLVLAYPA